MLAQPTARDAANAIGAAIAQVTGKATGKELDRTVRLRKIAIMDEQ